MKATLTIDLPEDPKEWAYAIRSAAHDASDMLNHQPARPSYKMTRVSRGVTTLVKLEIREE
jgi:hypothetical protein